ncbi:hypothetical protein [Jeotgalibaca porci]|uniref:hypothetical protein n=1 Tax=Jeotgalibaca porci TaxID=1868793 RepID=UPI00359FCD64
MYSKIDILTEKEQKAYVFLFNIPFFSLLFGMLWFDFYSTYSLILMGIIYLTGEVYFINKLDEGKLPVFFEVASTAIIPVIFKLITG